MSIMDVERAVGHRPPELTGARRREPSSQQPCQPHQQSYAQHQRCGDGKDDEGDAQDDGRNAKQVADHDRGTAESAGDERGLSNGRGGTKRQRSTRKRGGRHGVPPGTAAAGSLYDGFSAPPLARSCSRDHAA